MAVEVKGIYYTFPLGNILLFYTPNRYMIPDHVNTRLVAYIIGEMMGASNSQILPCILSHRSVCGAVRLSTSPVQ